MRYDPEHMARMRKAQGRPPIGLYMLIFLVIVAVLVLIVLGLKTLIEAV